MLKLKSYNYKQLPAAFLLVIYLFFSFITIAGYRTAADSVIRQNVQTELIFSAESTTNKEPGSYKKYLPPAKGIIADDLKYWVITLFVHNRLAKVKFNCRSRNLNPILSPFRFVQKKIIPKNLGEHSFSSFTA